MLDERWIRTLHVDLHRERRAHVLRFPTYVEESRPLATT
jgi:hypothetical protein